MTIPLLEAIEYQLHTPQEWNVVQRHPHQFKNRKPGYLSVQQLGSGEWFVVDLHSIFTRDFTWVSRSDAWMSEGFDSAEEAVIAFELGERPK